MRENSRETAPETVSCWLNGTSPAQAAVMLFVQEVLRVKLQAANNALMTWPARGAFMLGCSTLEGTRGRPRFP